MGGNPLCIGFCIVVILFVCIAFVMNPCLSKEEVIIMNHSNVAIIDIEAVISPANISTVDEEYWTGQYYGYNIPTYTHKPIIMALEQIVILQDTPSCTEENRSWAIDYILKFWYSQPEAGITLLRIAKRYGLTSEAVNKLQRI